MTSLELDNIHTDDFDSCVNALYKWQVSNCLHKHTISTVDPLDGTTRIIDVPCGTCDHCINTYRNEWYTRMFLHSLDYEYIYYITLTYASPDTADTVGVDYVERIDRFGKLQKYTICRGSHYRAALQDMHRRTGTLFSCNDHNTYGVRKSLPSALNGLHFTNYIKYLRKITGADLTFYGCGEYGHKFGHPHFHVIVWSHQPISYIQFRQAWSRVYCKMPDGSIIPYRGQKDGSRFACPFGHVDFADLKNNGTFDAGSMDKAGRFVFGYVCKYLNKKEFSTTQLDEAWRQLPFIVDMDGFGKRTQFLPLSTVIDDQYTLTHDTSQSLYTDNLGNPLRTYNGVVYTYSSFKKAFAPFTRCSTRKAIASGFVNTYIEDFKRQSYHLPTDSQGKSLVLPSYFVRKAREAILPLRLFTSRKGTHSSSVGNLQAQMSNLHSLVSWHNASRLFDLNSQDYKFLACSDSGLQFPAEGCGLSPIECLRRGVYREVSFYDVVNRVYYIPHFSDRAGEGIYFDIVRYHRELKDTPYVVEDTISCSDLCAYYCRMCDEYKVHTERLRQIAQDNDAAFTRFRSSCDFDHVKVRVADLARAAHEANQTKYDIHHYYLES